MNPFLQNWNTPYCTVPFKEIEPKHFLPALDHFIADKRREINAICEEPKPNFENVIEALEKSGKKLGILSSTFFNLNSAETNEDIQSIAETISSKLSALANEITMNQKLFEQVRFVYENTQKSLLNPEQKTLLEKTYKRFVRNGALADENTKEKIKEIDLKLAELKVKFGQNVLAETNDFEMVIEHEKDLAGLPDSVKNAARELAQQKGLENAWIINLQYPSYLPFITYAQNRELRQKLFIAFASRGYKNNEHNNEKIALEIANLRRKRAQLLGYHSHAHFVLEERMAETPNRVRQFLSDLVSKSLEPAKEQVNEVALYAAENGAELPLQRWDFAYWSEKLKKEKYAFDDEMLKPFFKLENVVNGVFDVAKKLYGLRFQLNNQIQTYHLDVKVYEVFDRANNFVAVFYADFHPRKGKRPGAWMTSYRGQYLGNGLDHRPHISIVCNFSKPTETEPSLLTFMEVKTLFHEFGHALHGMLAKGQYESLSGTHVYWDFVELPSQILENWCYEKECLDLFAKHYKTGETIPEKIIEKLKLSSTYLEAYQTVRQVNFGLLDMAWHDSREEITTSIADMEKEAMGNQSMFPAVEGTAMSTAFSHIFNGGYSAGYYSYKWAEVLDADAFEAFAEKGIFNREIADRFRENILEKGGSEHPMVLYKRFRGREPDINALLRRAGLLD